MVEKKKPWPASRVVMSKVADLVPYARNARVHTPQHVDMIAASIREWGFTQPILRDEEGMILAGHGRLMAAQKLGLEEVPTIVAEGWSEAQKRAYVLADNRLTELSTWDMEMVGAEIAELTELGFDTDLIGFSDDILGGALPDFGELEKEFGSGAEDDFWPVIKIRVPPELKKQWDEKWTGLPGSSDPEKLRALLASVH